MSFADCAVLPDPTETELGEIAGLAADNFRHITGLPPVVAFLSFSTKGSAEHPLTEKVRNAAIAFRASRPDVPSDGELQLDAAVDPGVARLKAPGSPAAGKCERPGLPRPRTPATSATKSPNASAGPSRSGRSCRGSRSRSFDLSRGCSVDDIVRVATINALTSV